MSLNEWAIGSVKHADHVQQYLEKAKSELTEWNFTLHKVPHLTQVSYICTCHVLLDDLIQIHTVLARQLTLFITEVWERQEIQDLIMSEYPYYDVDEVEYLTEIAVNKLFTLRRGAGQQLRSGELQRELINYLKAESKLHIDGMILFRLQDFRLDLPQVIGHVIDEYLMDREYQEFVKLLRYFLEMQKISASVIHLICDEKGTILLDDEENPIQNREMQSFQEDLIDPDIQQDDMILSMLITIAPHQVCIHQQETYPSAVVETVQRVFGERAMICPGCGLCRVDKHIFFQ